MVEIGCKLSPRELDVLKYISKGLSNCEIAETLYITENTVRNVLQNIHAKTGFNIGKNNYAATRVKLALFYLDNYEIKKGKEYQKGFNDGLMQIVKYVNTLKEIEEVE